jgi:hypothetical protein
MFESSGKLTEDIIQLLEVLREMGRGRYACLVDRKRGILLETPEKDWALRSHLDENREALFALPAQMAGEAEIERDVFEGWHQDDFFLAFLNMRAVLVVVCDDAHALREQGDEPLRILVDRMLRLEPAWRISPEGRGLFMGRPQLDIVVAGRHHEENA